MKNTRLLTERALVQLQPPDLLQNMTYNEEKGPLPSGYIFSQLEKAFRTAREHSDKETKERAVTKASEWLAVIRNVISGAVRIGSRTPTGAPAWATPRIISGGFATGELLANGALRPHEVELLSALQAGSQAGRALLNRYFLSDDGLKKLKEMLESGCYRIEIAEEGALLVIAWLLAQPNALVEAVSLLNELEPRFSSLRFYPLPSAVSLDNREVGIVAVETVESVIERLAAVTPSREVLAQKETIELWIPLYDHAVSLLLETIKGESPHIGDNGEVMGGYPSADTSDDWKGRARQLTTRYRELRKRHSLCKDPERRKGSFFQVRHFLTLLSEYPETVDSRDLSRIRTLIARYVMKRGAPGSAVNLSIREKQFNEVRGPTYDMIAQTLIERLRRVAEVTVDDIDLVLEPHANTPIPEYFKHKLELCLQETPEILIERKIIRSADTLAQVIPQITAWTYATSFEDPSLRRLVSSIYKAFRKRRSVLLLNLQSQVKLQELPWISALSRFSSPKQASAKTCLADIAFLTLRSFPHSLVPNALLAELRELALQAHLAIPLIDELAADIFCNQFTNTFLLAAREAGRVLSGTLYERYYCIDYEQILSLSCATIPRGVSPDFYNLCFERVQSDATGSAVARNGMIIEQQQILTTHNLASLVGSLGLLERLQPSLIGMVRRCFSTVCWREGLTSRGEWRARLKSRKASAYAWRQMIFFLSLVTPREQEEFLQWADDYLLSKPSVIRASVVPLLRDLKHCIEDTPEVRSVTPFLGWGVLKLSDS